MERFQIRKCDVMEGLDKNTSGAGALAACIYLPVALIADFPEEYRFLAQFL